MICRTFEVKVDHSKLSKTARRHLQLLFLEAKWYSNAIIASGDGDGDGIFAFDYKTKTVTVKRPEGFVQRPLTVLSSQMRQALLEQIKRDIIALAKKKEHGYEVGRLKYKKVVTTIPLKQHKNTYTIQRPNRIRIQGFRRWLKVRGLHQIPNDAELANAKLRYKDGDFFFHVTTYLPQDYSRKESVPLKAIGIDGGIAHQLTLSNGIQVHYNITIDKKIRRLCRQLARKKYGSKNYVKTLRRLRRLFARWTRQKGDTVNQIVSLLTSHYQIICFQKDHVANWQRIWGTRILNTALGALFTTLDKRAVTPVPLIQWVATTKRCSNCGHVLTKTLSLSQRTFNCPNCGFTQQRDWNAARCIKQLGLSYLEADFPSQFELAAERSEVTPPEIDTSTQLLSQLFAQLPFVSAHVLSLNEEAPSFTSG